jgi:serine/threonine-protein kinase
MIGTSAGSYQITAVIADGGMGTVYRAEHALIGRPAAVKILHPELSMNRAMVDRFFTEAKATGAIRHPNIVEVFDFGYMPSGHAYLVMELLDGDPLSRHLKRCGGRMAEVDAAWIVRALCGALAAAHAKGIVHRDLKPDNVFVVPDPETGIRPKLLDFGIAKLTAESDIAASKTRTGAVMGTPTYMSPEQCKGTGFVDHRADLYSLGCILYEMLCGRPPFVAEGAGELIGAHLLLAPEPPRVHEPRISPAMDALIVRLLAKNPNERPDSANALAALLDQIASTPSPRLSQAGMQTMIGPGEMPRPTPPPPMHTPMSPPATITTLGGAAGQNVTGTMAGTRKVWPIALFAVLLLGSASALTTYLIMERGRTPRAATTAEPTAPPPIPTPPPPPVAPAVVPADAAPAVVAEPIPEPEPEPAPPPTVADEPKSNKKKKSSDKRSPPVEKKPPDEQKPPDKKIGPIETEL